MNAHALTNSTCRGVFLNVFCQVMPEVFSFNSFQSLLICKVSSLRIIIVYPIKNCDLLFCCHFRRRLMLKMAAFQQTSSATLPHHLTTHQLTHCSCLRPPIDGRLILGHPWFPKGLGSSIASMSLCTFMGGQKWPPSVTRQPDSGQHLAAVAIFPQLMIPQLSFFFFFWPTATATSDLSTFPYFRPATFYPVAP